MHWTDFTCFYFAKGTTNYIEVRKDHMLSALFNEILILLTPQFKSCPILTIELGQTPICSSMLSAVLSAEAQVHRIQANLSNLIKPRDAIMFCFYQPFSPWEFFLTVQRNGIGTLRTGQGFPLHTHECSGCTLGAFYPSSRHRHRLTSLLFYWPGWNGSFKVTYMSVPVYTFSFEVISFLKKLQTQNIRESGGKGR